MLDRFVNQFCSLNQSRNKLLASMALFLALNAALAIGARSFKFDRLEALHHGWVYWPLKGYKDLKQAPDLLLIGSSLLQHVTYAGEADYLNKPVNALQHNRCQHLEDRLSEALGQPVSSYAIAIGGMHASDASVVTTGMLPKKKPAALIYLMAPRDVHDNGLPSPASTETFQVMSHLSDQSDIGMEARYSRPEKFDYAVEASLTRWLPLYDYRRELTTIFERDWRQELGKVLNQNMFVAQGGKLGAARLGIAIPEFDFGGKITIFPHDPRALKQPNNRLCYICTYQPCRPKPYHNQLMFLRRMLNFARDNGIKAVIVNMPLRSDNLTAMLPRFYDIYLNDLRGVTKECGAELVDMEDRSGDCKGKLFHDDDFTDTVHLNGTGSMKLVEALVEKLQPSTKLAIAQFHKEMQQAGQVELAHRNAGRVQ